jgi:hypothetical protein
MMQIKESIMPLDCPGSKTADRGLLSEAAAFDKVAGCPKMQKL